MKRLTREWEESGEGEIYENDPGEWERIRAEQEGDGTDV